MRQSTALERRIDAAAHRLLRNAPDRGIRSTLVEVAVFVLKQTWACVFGAALLAAIVAVRLWYPDDAALARNDFLTIAAVAIQVVMVAARLETGRELWVIVAFHVTGTVMEVFKTDVGSWAYAADGVLRIAGVPLFRPRRREQDRFLRPRPDPDASARPHRGAARRPHRAKSGHLADSG
jgi:hypothetical protein